MSALKIEKSNHGLGQTLDLRIFHTFFDVLIAQTLLQK